LQGLRGEIMPTEELYKKVQDDPIGDVKELTFEHPSQEEINDMARASHRPTLSYYSLPDKDKDKPCMDSIDYMPNVRYLEAVGATQKPGDRKYGAQDD